MKLVLLACLVLLAHTSGQAAEDTLGRLFKRADERAALDRDLPEASASPRSTRPSRLEGTVRRSSGHQTVWLDGQASHDKDAPGTLEDGALWLADKHGRPRRLKLGQSQTDEAK